MTYSIFQSTLSARRATRNCSSSTWSNWTFQSTLSARRATMELGSVSTNFANFNPRSPRGERRYNVNLWIIQEVKFQSTLSARRATVLLQPSHNLTSISIHALREESDSGLTFCAVETVNFNPRSPRGERRVTSVDDYAAIAISIHALREESDSLLQSLCQEHI